MERNLQIPRPSPLAPRPSPLAPRPSPLATNETHIENINQIISKHLETISADVWEVAVKRAKSQVLAEFLENQQPVQQPSIIKVADISAWEKNACPHCGSLVWVKQHRTWWQKLLKPNHDRCICRECRQQFWQK